MFPNHGYVSFEIKASRTINTSDFFKGINYWHSLDKSSQGNIIYGGTDNFKVKQGNIISWKSTTELFKEVG